MIRITEVYMKLIISIAGLYGYSRHIILECLNLYLTLENNTTISRIETEFKNR